MSSARGVACVGCGGVVPDVEGPTHPYMLASAGCWRLYGEWMAERAAAPHASAVVRAHHVDAYAVQHPDGVAHDRRQRQSVAVHLVVLCLALEHDVAPRRATAARAQASERVLPALGRDDWPLLSPPAERGTTTLSDVARATGADLEAAARRWLRDAWDAWHVHHAAVRTWADVLVGAW